MAKKTATTKNKSRQLPIHTYPSKYKNEKTAVAMLNRDLHFGADVNHADKWDRTPLHYACMKGFRHYADALLQIGATPGLCDIENRCPEESIPVRFLGKFQNFGTMDHDYEWGNESSPSEDEGEMNRLFGN